ncbi:MAG TPA: CBS domain-containing protein [Kofleriaceae bacterium]
MQTLNVGSYATKQPWTLPPSASLVEARRIMRDHHVRELPVVAAGRLVGIVALRDLRVLETVADVPLDAVTAEEAMLKTSYTVTTDARVDVVAEHMERHKLGVAIVVDRSGTVEGIFSIGNACRAIADLVRRIL